MTLHFISDWREMFERALDLLAGSASVFYGRIGGSDTDAVIDYLEGLNTGEDEERLYERVIPHLPILKRFNGYYDKEADPRKVLQFCDDMIQLYAGLNHATLVGSKWQTLFFRENINPMFWQELEDGKEVVYRNLLDRISDRRGDVWLYPFPFVEKCVNHQFTLFRVFERMLPGKKVLAITPFSATITTNYERRASFFRDYTYPEFDLLTYTTPITYSGLPDDYYPHKDWFETVNAMEADIGTLDFDIALLACGSYAMPLGDFIANRMKKKAVYVGGVLQLFFGIMGRRYENPFFTDQINLDAFRRPKESQMYLSHVKIAPTDAKEAFGAYF